MAILALARDFREFLKLLNSRSIEYLLVGGYDVRTTNDLDVWVKIGPGNARRLGIPPIRIEILTSASGLEFEDVMRSMKCRFR